MPISIVTKQLRDAADNIFVMQCVDRSGTGAGPFVPLHIIGTADGANALDFEALNTAMIAAIAAGNALLDGDLDAILAKLSADPATGAKQDTLVARIGELQASPTANTVLDRLKAIAIGLTGVVLAAGTAAIGKVGLQVGGADVAASNPIPIKISAPDFQASGLSAVSGVISAIGPTAALALKAGRQAYLTLWGGTSLSGAVLLDLADGKGAAPIMTEGVQLGIVSYSGSTIRIKLPVCEQAGCSMVLNVAAFNGAVSFALSQ